MGVFIALDVALVAFVECGASPRASPPTSSAEPPITPSPTVVARPEAILAPPAARATASSVQTAASAAGARSLDDDARAVAKEILNAIATKDDAFIGSLMPEEVDADPTTLRRYEWDQLRNQMLQAGPKLSELARDKGIDQVVKVRAGEVRLMLYHAEGKASGQALILTRTDHGWLLTGSTYMRD